MEMSIVTIALMALLWLIVTMIAFWFLVKVMGFDPKEAMEILREMLELKRADLPGSNPPVTVINQLPDHNPQGTGRLDGPKS